MRVVHVVPALFGHGGVFGGAERYVYELAKAMARETPTTLLSFGAHDRSFYDGPLEVRVIGRPWLIRRQPTNPFSLRILPHLVRADVVHCHQRHIVTSTFCAALGRLFQRPVFVTDLGGGGWDLAAYVQTDGWFRGHLHISEHSRRNAQHTPGTRASVILGGVNTERFAPAQDVERERAVLFVGRLMPHKGVDVLVRAVDSETTTWLAGTEGLPRYRADLEALSAGKRVQFLRGLDDAGIIDLYRRASVLVLPSVYRSLYGDETTVPELLGQTLLEAMACETPVICSNVASMPEIVDDGVTGFVVPPNDPEALSRKLRCLLDDPALAREMGKRARETVLQRFSWNAVVARCLKAYAGEGGPRVCAEPAPEHEPGVRSSQRAH